MLSVSDFLKVLRKRWLVVMVALLLVVSASSILTMLLPRWYLATATISVEKPEGEVSVWQVRAAPSFDPFFIKTQFEVIQSKKILYPVIENLELQKRFVEIFEAGLTREEVYLLLTRKMLRLKAVPNTTLIEIGVMVKGDPVEAARIANEIARVYETDRIAYATSGQNEGIEKLKDELRQQEEIVRRERDTVERLRQELQISGIDLNAEAIALEVEQLRNMERTLSALRVDAIAGKTRWQQFAAIPKEERFTLINAEMVSDGNLQGLMQAYLNGEQQYAVQRSRLGENHPDLQATRANLAVIRAQLGKQLDGYIKSLEISYLEAQARVSAMEDQLDVARIEQIESASNKMRQFEDAVTKLRDEENLLKAFRISLRQREIDFQVPKRTIELLSEAEPPEKFARPNIFLNVALGIVVGVAFGVGLAFFLEFLDSSFRSVEEIERVLQVPILGVVARRRTLVGEQNFSTAEAEPYRVMHTNLRLAPGSADARVIAVQSAGPGEGKSTTLHNLAQVIALSGMRVLVIDTDLRRPSQHRLFDLERGPGMMEYLQGDCTVEEAIRETQTPGLFFVGAGLSGDFSLNLLHSQRLGEFIESCRKQYDRVFIDSPPIVGISDSSVLASMSDGVVFVAQHGRYAQSMILRGKTIIDTVGGSVLGAVLNQVPDSGNEDYNYYTSNYSYYGSTSNGRRKSRKRSSKSAAVASESPREVVSNDLERFEIAEPEESHEFDEKR